MIDKEISSEQAISKTIHIKATTSKVWIVLTNPEFMKQWMSDYELNIRSEWKVGSQIQITGHLHGIPFENKGVILQLDPEKTFEYTFWTTLSEQADKPENYSYIKFILLADQTNTTLILNQSNFKTETVFKHWEFYWNATLEIIKQLSEK